MTAEVKEFTIRIEGVPKGWEPVAFRKPVTGEWFISDGGGELECNLKEWPFGPRLILRKKYTPEPWLKEAGFKWVARNCSQWFASINAPSRRFERWWWDDGRVISLNHLNFTPPDLPEDAADKNTLIEL